MWGCGRGRRWVWRDLRDMWNLEADSNSIESCIVNFAVVGRCMHRAYLQQLRMATLSVPRSQYS